MSKKPIYKSYNHQGGFVAMPRIVLRSKAYNKLSCTARCLLLEFQNIHRPHNNGYLSISVSNAEGLLGVSDKTARKYFKELEQFGFLDLIKFHNYTNGKAREYRLTFQPFQGREPTNEFLSLQ
jgi:hypothetical protein